MRVTNEVIVERIDGLKVLTSEKFNQVNKRLDKINGRLNNHGDRLDSHSKGLIRLDERSDKARSGFGAILMKFLRML